MIEKLMMNGSKKQYLHENIQEMRKYAKPIII